MLRASDRVDDLNAEIGVFVESKGEEIGRDGEREQPPSRPALGLVRDQEAHHIVHDDGRQDDGQKMDVPVAVENKGGDSEPTQPRHRRIDESRNYEISREGDGQKQEQKLELCEQHLMVSSYVRNSARLYQ